jgi:putative endonuclease
MYTLYVLECSDGSLYTGISNNLGKRLRDHESGKGSKFVRSRLPFRVVYTEELPSRSAALKRENTVQSMDRRQKLELISGASPSLGTYSLRTRG